VYGKGGEIAVYPEVAVCINDNGVTSSLDEANAIVIYQKVQGSWKVIKEQKFSLDKEAGLVGLRRQMAEIILFLGQCKIFVGCAVVGVPYFELEKNQCSIWEFEGKQKPLSFLDYVLKQEEDKEEEEQSQGNNVIPLPIERQKGDYYISIKEIQENTGGISSKQVLLPFLRQGKFYRLEVLCNHIPPWLEAELTGGNLVGEVEKTAPAETHVYISKRVCEK
jgi:Fe-only nitrogenase accessory protein AnfO